MELSNRQYGLYLALIFLFALALRVGITARFQGLQAHPDFEAQPDQIDYERLAYHMLTKQGYSLEPGQPSAHRPPGTSFVLLSIYTLFGRSFVAGRLWFCFLSAATCLATAWLARQYGSRLASLIAAAWLAFYPGHFYHAMHFVSEVPGGLWLALACVFTLRSMRQGALKDGLLGGLFWGFAILTRPQVIFILPIAWLLLVILPKMSRRYLLHLVLQTGVIILLLAPWVIRNAFVMGKPTLSTVGAYTFWGAHNDIILNDSKMQGSWVKTGDLIDREHPFRGSEIELEAAAWRYGLEFIANHPGQMPKLLMMKVWRMFSPFIDTPNRVAFWAFALGWMMTLPFVFYGMFLTYQYHREDFLVTALPIAATLVTTIIFYGSTRFRDFMAPIFVVYASIVIERLLYSLRQIPNSGAGYDKASNFLESTLTPH